MSISNRLLYCFAMVFGSLSMVAMVVGGASNDVSGIYSGSMQTNLTLHCNETDHTLSGTFVTHAGYADGWHSVIGRASQCDFPAVLGFCISFSRGSACWVGKQLTAYNFEANWVYTRMNSEPWEETVTANHVFSKDD